MHLLVSVSNEAEVAAALEGGADLIDAKDPSSGALGAVSIAVFEKIAATVAGRRPLTAAIGDAIDEASIAHAAREFARRGAALVKVGFAATDEDARVEALLSAAVSGAASAESGRCGVIAVAYADVCRPEFVRALVPRAARAGARGVLVDTADKGGPGLCDLVDAHVLAALIADARDAGVLVALAGRLRPHDLPLVCDLGADVAGVRGAACVGGRSGRIVAEKVRLLKALCRDAGRPEGVQL
jgi:uncharacterized protein (UPF0264 family)